MKTITISDTNNKMACNVFLHIDKAPSRTLLESELPLSVIVCHAPEQYIPVSMIGFIRCKLYELNSAVTMVSHGITREQFIVDYLQKPNSTLEDKIAIYTYVKTN